jgi:hypothetical protein
MDPIRLPKIMIYWKPEGKNEAIHEEPGKMEYTQQ